MTLRPRWLAAFTAASMTFSSVAQDQPVPATTTTTTTLAPGSAPIVEGAPVVTSSTSQPLLTVEAGVTFLRRSRPHRKGVIGELVNLDTNERLRTVTTESLDFDFEAGTNLMLRIHNQAGGSLDIRWLGLDSFSDRSNLETEEFDPIGTTTPTSPFGFVLEEGAETGGIRARAKSWFHSLQVGRTNIMRDDDEMTVTNYVGVRYIYFRDLIEIERAGSVDFENYGWVGNNNLFGGEVGLDVARHYGFLTLGAKGKIGGYYNRAELKGHYDLSIGSQPNVAPINFKTSADEFSGFSGVLDLGIYSTIHASRNFALKFGYDFMIITNLVNGSENLQPSVLNVTPVPGALPLIAPGALQANGSSVLYLNGLSVSGEVTW